MKLWSALIVLTVANPAAAQVQPLPTFDSDAYCQREGTVLTVCQGLEREARERLSRAWADLPARMRDICLCPALVKSYQELRQCLAGAEADENVRKQAPGRARFYLVRQGCANPSGYDDPLSCYAALAQGGTGAVCVNQLIPVPQRSR